MATATATRDDGAIAAAAAGPSRVGPPPRSLSGWRLIQVLDAGVHGYPVLRYLALMAISLLMALAVLLPDLIYAGLPERTLEAIDAAPRDLPPPLDGIVPADILGYEATFRLPGGEVQRGPVDGAEAAAIAAGEDTIAVHMSGGERARACPDSGLFSRPRVAVAGLLTALAVLFGLLLAARVKGRWWMVRVARHGVETIGRVTELESHRLVHGEKPVGRQLSMFWDVSIRDRSHSGSVKDFRVETFHPFAVDRPLRVLVLPDPPHRSMPTELLPLPRKTD